MTRQQLSTTAVAVLGLLGIRSMTGYELTAAAQRTYRYLWHREDSVLYDQPRRLEAKGLVSSAVEDGLRKQRTRYAITDAGREAVREWLTTPVRAHFDWEPAVRFILADQGSREDLLRTVRAVRDWALEAMREGLPVAEAILDGTGPYPERRSLNGLNGVFVVDLLLAVHGWSEAALVELEGWTSPTDDGGNDGWRDMLAGRLDELRAVISKAR